MTYIPEFPSSDLGQDAQGWLAREFEAIQNRFLQTEIGTAGLQLKTPAASSLLLTQTPVVLTAYDSKLEPELFAEADPVNGTIKLLASGLWFFAVKGVARVAASSANQSRGVVVEIHNQTKSQVYQIIDYASIGRFQDLVSYTIAIPLFVSDQFLGDDLVLRAYAANTNTIQFTSVEILYFEVVLLNKLEIIT